MQALILTIATQVVVTTCMWCAWTSRCSLPLQALCLYLSFSHPPSALSPPLSLILPVPGEQHGLQARGVIWILTSVSVYQPDSWDVAAQNSCFPSLRLPPCWFSLFPSPSLSRRCNHISQHYIRLIASMICCSYNRQTNAWFASYARC